MRSMDIKVCGICWKEEDMLSSEEILPVKIVVYGFICHAVMVAQIMTMVHLQKLSTILIRNNLQFYSIM